MDRFEVLDGTSDEATVIGIVYAADEIEAISTLQAYKNGFKITGPGIGVPSPYVEWAHDQIGLLDPHSVSIWRAHRTPDPRGLT